MSSPSAAHDFWPVASQLTADPALQVVVHPLALQRTEPLCLNTTSKPRVAHFAARAHPAQLSLQRPPLSPHGCTATPSCCARAASRSVSRCM